MTKAQNARYSYNGYLIFGGKKYSPIDCYVEALKRDPEYAEAWYELGYRITKMRPGENTDKKLTGMDLFKDEPKITDDKRLHAAQIDAAKFCFDKAIEIEPKYVDAWYRKGKWCRSWEPPEKEGIECLLEVTKLDPKYETVWFDLAKAYGHHSIGKAVKCYDKAIELEQGRNYIVYAKKADLLSECVKQPELFYRGDDSGLKKKYSSGKDALMCYDKALEIRAEYGYAAYKKGMLLERLSRYEEALECFEGFGDKYGIDRDTATSVWNSNQLHRQALRDKLKPNKDGSTESFEIYCDVLKNFFKDNELSEVEYVRKKLNENILQHIHKLDDDLDEDDFYETGEWLQNTDREKEALELYDKQIEKELEKGDLHMAAWANETKADYLDKLGRSKDEFDCFEKTIQFCEKSRKDLTDEAAEYLSTAYSRNAHDFKTFGNMDKAIEYIDHAIKLEREYGTEAGGEYWNVKARWLPDEEAIKFIDEVIKAWQNSCYYDDSEDDKEYYIDSMKRRKNELLKKLAK